jgi:hypothetical protein
MRLSEDVVALLRNPETPDEVLYDAVLEMRCDVAKVYVVSGNCGSYSDYISWTVAAFLNEDSAKAECEKLNSWCKENKVHREQGSIDYDWYNKPKNPLDHNFQCDYTGTEYVVEAIQLKV